MSFIQLESVAKPLTLDVREVWRVRIGRVRDLAATPILELIASHPQLRAILDGFGLDTCCGGHFSITEAAAHDGIDVQPVMAALQAVLKSQPHEPETP